MDPKITRESGRFIERLCVWTVRHHDFVRSRVCLYTWTGTVTVLFFTIAMRISIETALSAILFSGLAVMMILWILIERRKTILLGITDPDLREQAYAAMLSLICSRKHMLKGDYSEICRQIQCRSPNTRRATRTMPR